MDLVIFEITVLVFCLFVCLFVCFWLEFYSVSFGATETYKQRLISLSILPFCCFTATISVFPLLLTLEPSSRLCSNASFLTRATLVHHMKLVTLLSPGTACTPAALSWFPTVLFNVYQAIHFIFSVYRSFYLPVEYQQQKLRDPCLLLSTEVFHLFITMPKTNENLSTIVFYGFL